MPSYLGTLREVGSRFASQTIADGSHDNEINIDDAVDFVMGALPDVLLEIAIDILSLRSGTPLLPHRANAAAATAAETTMSVQDHTYATLRETYDNVDELLDHVYQHLTQVMKNYTPEWNPFLEHSELGFGMRQDAADRKLKEAGPLYYEPEGATEYETPG
jgi:hypothetical protein